MLAARGRGQRGATQERLTGWKGNKIRVNCSLLACAPSPGGKGYWTRSEEDSGNLCLQSSDTTNVGYSEAVNKPRKGVIPGPIMPRYPLQMKMGERATTISPSISYITSQSRKMGEQWWWRDWGQRSSAWQPSQIEQEGQPPHISGPWSNIAGSKI